MTEKTYPIKHKMYLHSDKEENIWEGKELGLTEDQIRNFRGFGYEVEFDVLIQEDGTVITTHVAGVALATPTEL
jgi:hypothetical protein